MLVSTKDQGLGRRRRSYSHSHVYSMDKLARSSKLSLLSAITSQSSGSNGSNSTVTQESYNKSKSESSRKRKSSKRKKEPQMSKTPPMEAVEEAVSEGEDEHEDVDVFAFLVDDNGTQRDTRHDCVPADAIEGTHEKDVSGQSLHSDSGISMDDGSIVLGQTTLRPLLSTLTEHRPLEQNGDPQIRFDWSWPDVPKPQQHTILPAEPLNYWHETEHVPHDANNGSHSPQGVCFTPDSPDSRHPSFSTWESLKSEVVGAYSETSSPPFRAFTQTCQKLLSELQLELSDLENELKRLEAYAKQSSHHGTDSAASSDRRGSWQWSQYFSDLHAMRADITGRLHVKLEQYCK